MKQAISDIIRVQLALLTPLSSGLQYPKWTWEFTTREINGAVERIKDIKIDFTDLTADECDMLGFATWDESGLRLIPFYLYPYIMPGQTVTTISGETITVGAHYREQTHTGYLDNDYRAGRLAFGIMPKP